MDRLHPLPGRQGEGEFHHLRRVPGRAQGQVLIRSLLAACLWVGLAALPAVAAGPQFPPLTGRVVDDAGVLSPAAQGQLTAELAAHEQRTKQQVVVATLKSLGGQTIEDYGYQLGRAW